MKPLPVDPTAKLCAHIDALFGSDVSDEIDKGQLSFEYSRRTGRVKNFSVGNKLAGTFRTDGGIAITIHGATLLQQSTKFRENCILASEEAAPFVSEGRSLFCKHVSWCGSNVKVGSDVAIIDSHDKIIAAGVSLLSAKTMMSYRRGVAARIREGIKGRAKQTVSSI